MKIVYISRSVIPSRIANSIHVMYMCNSLASLGHEVTLLVPDMKNTELTDDVFGFYGIEHTFKIQKLFYPGIKGKTAFYAIHARSAIRKVKPDLVMGRDIFGCTMSAVMGIPTVFDSHGPIWEMGRLYLRLFKIMVSKKVFKKMTVNSASLKSLYEETPVFEDWEFDPKTIQVAYNGARSFSLEDRIALPGRNDNMKVGYLGHLYSGRGIEIIVELAKRLQSLDFYIVGGEESDIAYWKEKAPCANLFFLGFVPYAEVYKYRNSFDLLLAPYQKIISPGGHGGDQSRYMNPIKIIEYMSSRKPIVASDLTTIREVLNDRNAALEDGEDVEGWEKAIQKIVKNQEYAQSIAEKAYADFTNHYTWLSRAKKLIDGVS